MKLPLLTAAALGIFAFAASASEPVRQGSDRALIDRYVQRVSAGPRSEPVSRWRDPICPLVAGLSREQGELVLSRLSEIAVQVGAPLGSQDCRPNLYIVATKDPRATIREWIDRKDGLFNGGGATELERFIRTDRPVRVWRNVSQTGQDGHSLSMSSQALVGAPGQASKPVLNWAEDSHISGNVAHYIGGVAVVLDPGIDKVKLGQLADYIALITFAGVNLDADIGEDSSILTLFRQGGAPQGLSAHDVAYLKALYAVPPHLLGQRVMIAQRMTQSVGR
jgi:hypothetical protein